MIITFCSFTEDSKSRKEALDLQEPRFVDESETEIDADYIRGIEDAFCLDLMSP